MIVAFLMHNPWFSKPEFGDFNGYVAFKENLPLSIQGGANQNTLSLDELISVHGGITFDKPSLWKEAPIIPLTEIPADIHTYRIIGFDTAHHGDAKEEWTFEKTKEETLNLKHQIEDLITFLNEL